MTRADRRHRWRAASVRFRLGLALGLALLPVLVLSGLQSALVFQRDANDKRADLVAASSRVVTPARLRIAESQALLRGLGPGSNGYGCVSRLADVRDRTAGVANIIRFNSDGWVTCSASPVPVDARRSSTQWFRTLASGGGATVTNDPELEYASGPALLTSVRVESGGAQFAGVLTAVVSMASLLPEKTGLSTPNDSEVALADSNGRFISTANAKAFPSHLDGWLTGAGRAGGAIWLATDRDGESRLLTATPVVGREVYLVLSAPSEGLFSWARLNPISAFLLPILAFALALAAVWWVADHEVVRWIVYLRRIAALYARGRYSVRPLRAVAAPAELRDLADAFDTMASTIAARDAALKENLLAKDDLMREIHHRVKNNLQVISSLLNIQQRVMTDPAAISAINDTRQRIIALGQIYRTLYEGPNLKQVDFKAFLGELVGQLLLDYKGRDHSIRTSLNVDPLVVDPDRLAPLALFIVETINNSCKHDFHGVEGIISIAFHVHEGQAELVVSDTGTPVETEDRGRKMMAVFARQLGGVLSDPADQGGDTAVRLSFPMRTLPMRPSSVH
jgi:two-component sensor histidine kinase